MYKCEYCRFSCKYEYQLKIHPPECPSKINKMQYTLDELKQLNNLYIDINNRDSIKDVESYYKQAITRYDSIQNHLKT